MNVLLINAPIRLDAKPNCIPYGLATIANVLRDKNFDVDLLDVNALRLSNTELIETLREKSWDVVGVSGLITTYGFQEWLLPQLKTLNPEAIIVSGGGLATSNSELLFQHTPVDMTVAGEGEESMLDICMAIERGRAISDIHGISFRENERIVHTGPRDTIKDMDSIPLPAWDLLPMDIYLNNPIWGGEARNSSGFLGGVRINKSMNIISSRGCPFSCNYCYHLFGRSNYRFRSAMSVVHEIEILVDRYDVDFIGFVDDNMMASESRLLEFCDLMEKKKLSVTWGCHGRVTSAKPYILRRMADVGCVWIGYGIESGSEAILKLMNKRATVEQARTAIMETRGAGIFPNTTFIYGYPGESLETIQQTVEFKRNLNIQCGSFFATPYPGTPLYNQIRYHIHDTEAFIKSLGNATDFTINLTEFSDEDFFKLKEKMDLNQDVL